MTKSPYPDPGRLRSRSIMATAAPELPVLARDRAFESLYRSYVKDVYHYALAMLRNPADAEDVTQTTFLNAYRAYMRGVTVEKPQNWLIKIAHNVARTRYARASRRVKEVPLDEHVEQLAVPEDQRPDVKGVLDALGRLPFNQRAALVMRELEGRSYVEIADTIGVSVSAVEALIFRARRSLRLKASALRALAAVPLPSSLAQFLGGGTVVAGGGGALAGTGLLVKAAVALIAGAIAGGISGDHSRPAVAAGEAPGTAARSLGVPAAPAVTHVHAAARGATTRGQERAPAASVPVRLRTHETSAAGANSGPASTATRSGGDASGAQAAPIPPTASQVSETLSAVVEQVSAAVPIPSAPALPVPLPAVPSVPALPVETPEIPGGTPLP
jgi:RNA polymerase sigma factor (sigma-70 family)